MFPGMRSACIHVSGPSQVGSCTAWSQMSISPEWNLGACIGFPEPSVLARPEGEAGDERGECIPPDSCFLAGRHPAAQFDGREPLTQRMKLARGVPH